MQFTSRGKKFLVRAMKFNLEIAEVTRNLQSLNGLRHGDYHRYRHFCTRKLRRVRSSLKIQNGRHRFKKTLVPDVINSVRFVELLVVQAERSWAHGLTLKSEYAIGETGARGKIRHRFIQKFYRAVHWANELVEIARRSCDTQTIIEAEAYQMWLNGLALTEDGKYEAAMVQLNASIEKYTELIKQSLDVLFPAASKAYKHRMSDLEPVMRVCKYKLRIGLPVQQEVAEPKRSEASPRSVVSDFESVMSDEGEGEVEFSSSDSEIEDDSVSVSSPKRQNAATGLLGKIGGWWSKN